VSTPVPALVRLASQQHVRSTFASTMGLAESLRVLDTVTRAMANLAQEKYALTQTQVTIKHSDERAKPDLSHVLYSHGYRTIT
jgi:hypothetical protein